MSLSCTMYAQSSLTPEEAIAVAFPGCVSHSASDRSWVQTDALDSSIRRRTKPNFDLELLGFEATISIYFAINKQLTIEARQQLAVAIRNFLSSTTGAVAVMYLDILVLKRVGESAVCAAAYADMLPHSGIGWRIVPELEQPE